MTSCYVIVSAERNVRFYVGERKIVTRLSCSVGKFSRK